MLYRGSFQDLRVELEDAGGGSDAARVKLTVSAAQNRDSGGVVNDTNARQGCLSPENSV